MFITSLCYVIYIYHMGRGRTIRPLPLGKHLGKHAVLQLLRTLWSAIDASCNARFGCGLACPVRHVGAATGELQCRTERRVVPEESQCGRFVAAPPFTSIRAIHPSREQA